MLNLNFSSVPDRSPLEEGVYELQISKVEEKISSNGNPMLLVTFDVQGVDGNRKLFENYVLTDEALWKLKELFDALDIDTSDIVDLDPMDLVGSAVSARVIQDEYKGEIVNRVKKIIAGA